MLSQSEREILTEQLEYYEAMKANIIKHPSSTSLPPLTDVIEKIDRLTFLIHNHDYLDFLRKSNGLL